MQKIREIAAVKSGVKPAEVRESRFLFLLLILFFGSGCSALIYEIVWYQLLQLVIGSTTVSLAALLATFMGGLCVGSMVLPRVLATRRYRPLRVYAVLELGTGLSGILVLFGMPFINRFYVGAVGHGLPAMLLRAAICGACLLPPTLLMGASLPAIARSIQATPRGVFWLGLLYGGNIAGAVFGCLWAGFYLLRVFDIATATYFAAAINAGVALTAFILPMGMSEQPAARSALRGQSSTPPREWPVYVTIALSGACALGAEVVWTRLLGLMLGPTVYTFSIILAVFLVGLGIGSGGGSWLAGAIRPQAALGYCQLLLTAAIAWTAFALAESLPYWSATDVFSSNPWLVVWANIVRVGCAILPATLLWGASFALALAAAAPRNRDSGRLVGNVYAANTAGAIVGALAFSILLIPSIGTHQCERVLIVLSCLSALFVLVPFFWSSRAKRGEFGLAAILIAAGFLVLVVPPVPPEVIAYGRFSKTRAYAGKFQVLYVGEGLNSSIAISRWGSVLQFHVSGKVEASTQPRDMRLQRMLGHMPALLHPKPRSVLVVGFGAGVTAGSFVLYPDVQRIVICEIEPLIPPAATRFFGTQNYDVLNDKRTQVVYDDARHYVLTTPEKFDIVTSDPIHPWVKGSATLYSKEYFEIVKQHLNPGGVATQWVPLYETDLETVKSEIATFCEVFPNATIWANDVGGVGYDVFLLGRNGPLQIDADELQRRLDRPEYARVAQSLREVGFSSAVEMLATYAGQESDLKPWLNGAEINRDRNLRLQYLAGWALNSQQQQVIHAEIFRYRRFPLNLFAGSDAYMQSLRDRFYRAGR